jgi:hypothetical protein
MRAALALLGASSRSQLYETVFFAQHLKFQYPPTSLLPLDVLDQFGAFQPHGLNAAGLILTFINAVAVGRLADVLLSRPMQLTGSRRATVAGLAMLSTLAFYPVVRGLQLGQIQVWLNLMVTITCLLLAHGHETSAGVLMALASAMKPQFVPLLLISIVLRHLRFAVGFMAALVSVGTASLWRYGLHNHMTYVDVLGFIARHGESFFANNSINGIANRFIGNGDNLHWDGAAFAPYSLPVYLLTTTTGLAFIAIPFLLRPSAGDHLGRTLHFCLSILCLVMASPIAWEHHYGVLPPMFVVAVAGQLRPYPQSNQRTRLTLLTAAWLLSACKLDPLVNKLSDSVLNPLQATNFIGGIILLLVLVLQTNARRSAPAQLWSMAYEAQDRR